MGFTVYNSWFIMCAAWQFIIHTVINRKSLQVIALREDFVGNLAKGFFKPVRTVFFLLFLLFLFPLLFFLFLLPAFLFAAFLFFLLPLGFGSAGGRLLLFQSFVVFEHVDRFRWNDIGGRYRFHFLQAAILVSCGEQSEQCVLHAVFLQYIVEAIDVVVDELHGFHFVNLAAFAECSFHVLQIGTSTSEDDASQQFVFIAGLLQQVPYVGNDFLGTCFDDVIQYAELYAAAVLQLADSGCLAIFFLVEQVAVLLFQLFGFRLFHVQ